MGGLAAVVVEGGGGGSCKEAAPPPEFDIRGDTYELVLDVEVFDGIGLEDKAG